MIFVSDERYRHLDGCSTGRKGTCAGPRVKIFSSFGWMETGGPASDGYRRSEGPSHHAHPHFCSMDSAHISISFIH